MADEWDEFKIKDLPKTSEGVTPTDEWANFKIQQSKPTTKSKKIIEPTSHVENLPFGIGESYKKGKELYKNIEKQLGPNLDTIRASEQLAMDLPGSLLTSAVTGPGTLAGMAGQGLYGGAARARDIYGEKGANFDTSDVLDVLKSGGISSLGPLAGRMISPTVSRAMPPTMPAERPTVESIRAAARRKTLGETTPALDEFMRKRGAGVKQKKIEETAHKIGQGFENFPSTVTGGLTRAFMGAGIPWFMGYTHPALLGAVAAGSALGPHLPQMAAKYWHNTALKNPLNEAILKSLVTSGGINAP